MAAVGIQLPLHIGAARLQKALVRPLHALSVFAHRVFCAGKQQHWGAFVHPGQVFPVPDEPQAPQHIPVQTHRRQKLAAPVLAVGVHHFAVAAHPVIVGAVGAKGPVVGAEQQVFHRGGAVSRALDPAKQAGEGIARPHQALRLLAGAGDQRAGHPAGVADQIGPGDKGTHAVPQQKIRQAGVLRRRLGPQRLHIVHHRVPAVGFPEQALPLWFLPAFSVTQVVVAHHQKAPLRQPPGKVAVPLHIFADAVGDLQHRPGRLFPLPRHRVNIGASVGGRIEKFPASDHKDTPFCGSVL